MIVTAGDQGKPTKTVNADIGIVVRRNKFPPKFIGAPYEATVSENKRNGSGIFTLQAQDEDLQDQMMYELVGIIPAPEYFQVHPTTGTIKLIKSLKDNKALSYTVSTYSDNIVFYIKFIMRSHYHVPVFGLMTIYNP